MHPHTTIRHNRSPSLKLSHTDSFFSPTLITSRKSSTRLKYHFRKTAVDSNEYKIGEEETTYKILLPYIKGTRVTIIKTLNKHNIQTNIQHRLKNEQHSHNISTQQDMASNFNAQKTIATITQTEKSGTAKKHKNDPTAPTPGKKTETRASSVTYLVSLTWPNSCNSVSAYRLIRLFPLAEKLSRVRYGTDAELTAVLTLFKLNGLQYHFSSNEKVSHAKLVNRVLETLPMSRTNSTSSDFQKRGGGF